MGMCDRDVIYDIETFPNFFCVVFKHVDCTDFGVFECSERRCDLDALVSFIPKLNRIAGFESGTGFYINPTPPEDAARFLREVEL